MSWWARADDPDVLFVFFEDLKEDLERETRRIARFLGYSPEQPDWAERVAVAVEHSSYAFMAAHRQQFDEHLTRAARNGAMGLPAEAGAATSKVRQGQVGSSKHVVSAALRMKLARRWSEVVAPALGFENYQELLHCHRGRVREETP